MARRLHLGGVARAAPKLPLPGKLVFPSMHQAGHFSMLGLGDVVMPGLLLCFVLRYDAYKKTQLLPGGCETGVPPPRHFSRISYFHCSLIGYFLGLLTATVSSEVFKAAQPALLYLVPFTLLPLLTMAYLKVCYVSNDVYIKCFKSKKFWQIIWEITLNKKYIYIHRSYSQYLPDNLKFNY